jgi:hypothetical protein
MTEERWRSVAIVLAVVLVLLVALTFWTSLPPGEGSATARPSSAGAASDNPGSPSAPASPSEAASASPTDSPSASPSASASGTANAGVAQVTFSGFKLDAMDDPAGKARTFTFKTDGSGNVQAKLARKSPQGTTRFCLKVGATKPLCRNWSSGTLTGTTSATGQTTFVVTLIGVNIATPTVDLSLSFRARMPSVTLTNGRFDGTGSGGYNGQSGKVKVRSLGTITVKTSWGTEPTDYSWSYVDLTDPSNTGVFPGNGTEIDRTDTVAPSRSYGFSLVNAAADTGPVPMTMTLAWR